MTTDNDNFEALLKASEAIPNNKLSPGQKTAATIVGIDGETIFLDVGLKSEGVINSSEFIDEEGELKVTIGDTIEVYLLKSTGSDNCSPQKSAPEQAVLTLRRPGEAVFLLKVM